MVFAITIGCQNHAQAVTMQGARQVAIKRVFSLQSRPRRAQHHVAHVVAFQAPATSDASPISSTSLQVTVSLPLHVAYGEHLRLVGSDELLGGWEPWAAPELHWSEGNVWSINLDLPPGFTSEFKLVHVIPGQAPIWEYTPNRQLSIPATASPVTASLALAWCEPSFAESTLPDVEETVEPVVEESSSIQSAVAESGLVTPPFMSSVTSFFNGNSTAQTDKKTEKTEKDVAALEAAFVADPAVKETEENIEEVESPIIEESAAEPAVAETEAVLTAEPATEEDSVITELVETESSSTKMLKSAAKTAGAVALGVAGAALLSALAVDVADTAIIGAMAVAAGSAALGGSSSKTKKSTTSSLEDAEEGEEGVVVEEEERKITGAGETGVIIAAGLLSAYDATKAMVDSVSKKSVASSEDEAASEE